MFESRFDLITNRQEGAIGYLSDLLRIRSHIIDIGDHVGVYVWSRDVSFVENVIPKLSDFNVMLSDIKNLKNAVKTLSTTPAIPTPDRYDYVKANAVEQNLFDMEQVLYSMQESIIYASIYNYAGQEFYL